jgi:hypothetical protein
MGLVNTYIANYIGRYSSFSEHLCFRIFLCTIFNTASDSTVSEDAGIEPRTTALAVRHSNHSARSHPCFHGKYKMYIK